MLPANSRAAGAIETGARDWMVIIHFLSPDRRCRPAEDYNRRHDGGDGAMTGSVSCSFTSLTIASGHLYLYPVSGGPSDVRRNYRRFERGLRMAPRVSR
jgi:hypothetical protein